MKFKILNLRNGFILLVIFAACWITASKIEPFLHYHIQQTGFLTTYEFFHNYVVYAGGIADYAAEFISQFFFFNLWGSILIVAVAAIQGFIALDLVTRLSGKTRVGFSVFAAVFLLGVLVLCDYRYPYYLSIRLLFAFLFTWGFYFLYKRFKTSSLLAWPIIASLLFYLASSSAMFVFTLSTIFFVIYSEKPSIWIKATPAFILFSGLLPYLGYKFIFQTTLTNLYQITTLRPPEFLSYATYYQLYVYFAILPLLLLIFLFLVPKGEKLPAAPLKKGKVPPKVSLFKNPSLLLSLQLAGFAAAGYSLFVHSHEPLKKNLLRIEYYAQNEEWIKVLKVAEEIEQYDVRVNFNVSRAYAHLGQLPERLFTYPQIKGVNGLIFDNWDMNSSLTMPTSDLYYDLGFMSESLHWAFEAQTLKPNSPRILKRLVMINLINRKYKLAEEFLNVLDKNILYHDWVTEHKKMVNDTTLTNADKVIVQKRKFNPHKRYVHTSPLDDLKLLFETNPLNRFAYDYLITYTILDSDLREFMSYIPYYTTFNIKTLPRSWEETLSLYIIKNKTIPPFMTGETVSNACRERLMQFNNTAKQFNGDMAAAQTALRSGFENTFWYYMIYLDPKVTQKLNKKEGV